MTHEKKPRGYKVSIKPGRVTVEHRASVRPRTIAILAVGYFCYCLIPGVRNVLVDLYHSHDPGVVLFALLILSIPFLSGVTWFFFASGEVMYCDAEELLLARRRSWGRWHRQRFACAQVHELKRTHRGSSKTRNFTVLTFQYRGRSYDMLEDLNYTDSDNVLKACKAMGWDAIIVVDDSAAMQHDIAQRGWWVNPLRSPGEDEISSNKR